MAIVGTAFVRLRVIGDKLGNDIAKATKKAVEDASPDLAASGTEAGDTVSEGMGESVERNSRQQMDAIGDQIGDALGKAMGDSLGRSLKRRMGDSIKNGFSNIEAKIAPVKAKVQPIFDRFGDDWGKATSKKFTGIFSKALLPGLALIGTALPSVLAFAGAAVGALAATAVTALSAIGPALAGIGLTGVAVFGAIKISAGLIGLAMKQQTPQLDDYKERLDAFKTTIATPIQAGLLSGFNAAMRISQPTIEGLKTQLTTLGIVVGDMAIRLADAFRQPENLARLQTILANNNVFLSQAGRGVTDLAQVFAILLSHLGPITDFLGEMLRDLGQWALTSILAAEATGSLDGFITRMFDSLRYFVGILVDFGAGIWNVFTAAHGASDGMLTSLHDNAEAFRAWTGDPANQERMTSFFERMRIIAGQVLTVIRDIAGAALRGLEGTSIERFTGAMDTLRSLGAPIASMFREIQDAAGPQLQVAFQNFADMIIELANSGVIGIVAQALGNLFAIISTLLQIPGIGALLSFGAGLLVIFKTVSLLWTVLGPVIQILFSVGRLLFSIGSILVTAFGAIPVIIAAVVAGLIYFFAFTDTGRAIVMAAVHGIVTAFEWCRDAVVAAFDWVVDKLGAAWDWISSTASGLWTTLTGIFSGIGDSIAGVWNDVVSRVQSALGTVRDFIVGVWNSVYSGVATAVGAVRDFIVGVWNAIWGFIQPILSNLLSFYIGIFNGIRSVVETVLNVIYEIWIRIFPLLLLPIRVFYGVVILLWNLLVQGIEIALNWLHGIITTVWNAIFGFISGVVGAIRDVVVNVWNTIFAFISGVLSAIATWVTDRWNEMVSAVSTALSAIWGFITSVWNSVYSFLAGVVEAIVGFLVERWNNLVNNISIALNAIWSVVSSVWNSVSGFISGVMDWIGDRVSSAWNGLTGIIRGALNAVWGVVQTGWNNVVNFVQGALDRIGNIISNIWGGIESIGSGIVSGLKGAVNGIIDMINGVIGGINNAIDLANKLPGTDIPTIPKIPRLAKGGVAMPTAGGTLAIVAEAGRPERIEPLDSDGLSKRDRAMLTVMQTGSGTSGGVAVYIGTRELTELVDFVVEDREDRLADRMLTGTKG